MQILHKDSFDDEPESFAKMDFYVKENESKRNGHFHQEIYLNDAWKTIPESDTLYCVIR